MRTLIQVVEGLVDADADALLVAPVDGAGRFLNGGPAPLGGHNAQEISRLKLGLRTLAVYDDRGPVMVLDGWALVRQFGADLDLTGADLRGADLAKADLRGACLDGADLTGANLKRANAMAVTATRAVFDGADLRASNLRDVSLLECSFARADLSSVDFRGASVTRSGFLNADLTASFWEGTEPHDCFDFQRR
ncbi:pentapeptide repeat-containing protein [Microbacterium lacticum]|nr:pentapeptide repeat-containing protein [Microbacterium lacticum]